MVDGFLGVALPDMATLYRDGILYRQNRGSYRAEAYKAKVASAAVDQSHKQVGRGTARLRFRQLVAGGAWNTGSAGLVRNDTGADQPPARGRVPCFTTYRLTNQR